MTELRKQQMLECWNKGFKLKRIAQELGISTDLALSQFTQVVNEKFFGHTSKLES